MSSPVPGTIYAERLARVRAELAKRGLDGFVVPISDEHMSEYVGAYAQRMAWLTGFGGSAGSGGPSSSTTAAWLPVQNSHPLPRLTCAAIASLTGTLSVEGPRSNC